MSSHSRLSIYDMTRRNAQAIYNQRLGVRNSFHRMALSARRHGKLAWNIFQKRGQHFAKKINVIVRSSNIYVCLKYSLELLIAKQNK